MNQGSVEYESQEHADMHEIGSKLKNHLRGKGSTKGAKGVSDAERDKLGKKIDAYAEKLGVDRNEVIRHAQDVYADSKKQAAGINDGEHRPLKYSPMKGNASPPEDNPELPETPSAVTDDANDARQPERTSDPTPDTPVPHMPRHAKNAINDVALEYELDPEELFQFAHSEIEKQRDYHTQREAKKTDARKATGMNAGNLAKLENSGKDASSDNAARRGFDTTATELGMDGDEDVWGLIREGKQDLPKLSDPAFLRRMAVNLAHMKQNGEMSVPDPSQHYREPTTNDLGEFVPFSRPRIGVVRI
jgi:hypothetical protein